MCDSRKRQNELKTLARDGLGYQQPTNLILHTMLSLSVTLKIVFWIYLK